ncbi:MAG: YdeI/OmpD-associated family protein [Anaerolineae bacterium]|jgi:uncharacterized protein YdeI (YjbR/CyaY-like superfamily)
MDESTKWIELANRNEWRAWLEAHHAEAGEVWLMIHKKRFREEGVSLEQAVEEALCYGWIDSQLKSVDEKRYVLRFTPRRPDSVWSETNKRRVERLIREERMTDAGLERIAQAKESGQWAAAARREQVDIIPADLEQALRRVEGGVAAYRALTASRRKQLIYRLQSAKRPETRRRRIEAIVDEVS